MRNSVLLILFLNLLISIQSNQQKIYKLSYPNDQITYTRYSTPVITITQQEYDKIIPCSFHGHGGVKYLTAKCEIELIEHNLVRKYINQSSVVLELGGRFGTTSCTIANQLQNNGKLVVVEPDYRIWSSLEINRHKHFCNFYFCKKSIGNTSVTISVGGNGQEKNYDTTTTPSLRQSGVGLGPSLSSSSQYDANHRPLYYNYKELEHVVKLTFNTLLIDCEGCISYLFQSKDSLTLQETLQDVKLIILEADNSLHKLSPCRVNCVDYEEWIKKFHEIGLNIVERIVDKKFPWIEHLVFQRK